MVALKQAGKVVRRPSGAGSRNAVVALKHLREAMDLSAFVGSRNAVVALKLARISLSGGVG